MTGTRKNLNESDERLNRKERQVIRKDTQSLCDPLRFLCGSLRLIMVISDNKYNPVAIDMLTLLSSTSSNSISSEISRKERNGAAIAASKLMKKCTISDQITLIILNCIKVKNKR